jgi:hypothetical protein
VSLNFEKKLISNNKNRFGFFETCDRLMRKSIVIYTVENAGAIFPSPQRD